MTIGSVAELPQPLVIAALNVAMSGLVVSDVEPGATPPSQSAVSDQLPSVPEPLQVALAAHAGRASKTRSPWRRAGSGISGVIRRGADTRTHCWQLIDSSKTPPDFPRQTPDGSAGILNHPPKSKTNERGRERHSFTTPPTMRNLPSDFPIMHAFAGAVDQLLRNFRNDFHSPVMLKYRGNAEHYCGRGAIADAKAST